MAKFISGREAFLCGRNDLPPGCVMIDMDISGLETYVLLEALASRRVHFPVIAMSDQGDVETVVRVMRLGACDYLVRPLEAVSMAASLNRVFETLANDVQTHQRRQQAVARLVELTVREHDVLHGLMAGHGNKTLAYDLGLSTRTVEMHRASLMHRLGVQNLAQALRVAYEAGLDIETGQNFRGRG